MATLHGTINACWGHTTPNGPRTDSSGNHIKSCYLAASFTGTYAQADNADILTAGAQMASFIRDGQTPTVISAAFAAPGDEGGTTVGAGACTVSSTTVTFPLTGADLTTEHANGALGTWNRDIVFHVTYTTARA